MLDVIDTAKYIGIVLEFAGGELGLTLLTLGGELFDYILANRYLKEKDASRLFAQLISGVDYLHQKHIVHRDLKLENLLLDKHRNIIITDFGFANRFERDEDDLMSTSCGSPCYAAPELVVDEGLYVGTAVDVWSCGVILYAMLSGYLPYDDDPANPDSDNINLLYKYIMSTALNFPDHMSAVAKDLLLLMLVPNPQDRGTIAQIEEHQWLEPHHTLFERTVQEHEQIFADNMIKKSQQAKRDLAQRRRLQQEAKLVKALQRSQSSAPGVSLAPDQQRRGKDRHRSALPGTTTVPDYLFNAGEYVPNPDAPNRRRQTSEMERHATLPSMPTETQSTRSSPPRRAGSVKRRPEATDEPTTPTRSQRSKTPMSANKNRHTIQVEYDGDMTWEQVRPDLAVPSREGEQRLPSPAISTTPPQRALEVPQATETEIESSSEMASESSKQGNVTEPEAEATTPTASVHPGIAMMSSASSERTHTPPASTPPASTKRPREAEERPPSSSAKVTDSPQSTARSLPPGAATPTRQPMPPLPSAEEPSLPPSRPSTAAKRASRTRKGMSLDKFGLAKLLGQTNPSDVPVPRQSYIPVSKHNKSYSVATPQPSQPSESPSPETKKNRRRTLNLLGSSRNSTLDDGASAISSTYGGPAPPVVVGARGRPVQDQLSQGTPSIVTEREQETGRSAAASTSGTAKRVMDWFRRKSTAKDQLSTIQAESRAEDRLSNGRASMSVQRPARQVTPPRARVSFDQPSRSDTSSLTQMVQSGPIIVIQEETTPKAEREQPVLPPVEKLPVNDRPEVTRQPLASASSKVNVDPKAMLDSKLRTPERSAIPTRSKSQRSPASGINGSATPVTAAQVVSGAIREGVVSGEDLKLRLHTGLVDQSALSSRPPAEIMAEVRRVLQGMGIEIKDETEYRLRCTRVRRRKAGPTTGLSTGAFARMAAMGSTSSLQRSGEAKLPTSPSSGIGGLKGMLLRRGSSYSSQHSSALARSESDLHSHLHHQSLSAIVANDGSNTLYGEHSIDSGDEIRFAVELCRIKNLNGLYLLSIKRLRGSVWSFKFIYQTIVERCDTLTH